MSSSVSSVKMGGRESALPSVSFMFFMSLLKQALSYTECDSNVYRYSMYFSYNTVPKHKPTSSSGFQMEPAICFMAARKAGCAELTERQ